MKLSFFNRIIFTLVIGLFFISLTSAKRTNCKPRLLPLSSVHIIDRNGLSETISNKERLEQFQLMDFLRTQPYQKVLRIFARDSSGNIRSVATTYYENGNVKQFLEILNGRASGLYCEWHENGVASLCANVIGGTPDVTAAAEKTWLFDGISSVWTDDGQLEAEISYSQGQLEGTSTYYHPNGKIWKSLPYCKNNLDGKVEIYKCDGQLLQQINYSDGKKHGSAIRYWNCEKIANQEEYYFGKLKEGCYFDINENLVAEIKNGVGNRAIFGKEHIRELQEFFNGEIEGEVKVFNQEGRIKRIYHVKNGIKNGEEAEYYDNLFCDGPLKTKFSFYWIEGKIQGIMKSWYPDGTMESQREMANNAKNGVLMAWYKDGTIMMIEEYEKNKLIRGEYFKKGTRAPVSQVTQGKGLMTKFDAEGHFVQKINYVNGKPEL